MRKFNLGYIFIACLALVVFLSSNLMAQAQDEQQKLVTKLEVKGNKNISSAAVLSKVKTRIGTPFSQIIVSDDLKRLYALGYFTDIEIDLQDYESGVAVIFWVSEKPILKGVSVSGNRSVRTENLQKLIKSKIDEFFDLQQLKQDMRDIQKFYEARGFSLVDIEHKMLVDQVTNEAQITIVIQESKRVKIKEIFVAGNKSFKKKRILKLMRTRRDTLFTSGLFKKEVMELDLERILAFYYQNGFLDVKVSAEKSFGPKQKRMYITINIDEGQQYLVGEIAIIGALIFPEQEITSQLKIKSGDIFSRDNLRYDISNAQTLYFEKGYISAEVDVKTSLNEQTGKIDITYHITENELAYINKIKIRGNTKTRDIVIRRELRSFPSEAFDGKKLKRSKERLYNLGYFQEVSYDTEPTSIANRKDLVVNVKEAKTGEFAFGAGFSSVDKFVGFVEVAQKNFDITNWQTFTGAGQDIRVKAEFGTSRREYDLSFTEPWIFGYPLSFGVDGYSRFRERSGVTGYSYDEERKGADLRLGKEFTEVLRADLMYQLENVDISNVADDASTALRNEIGENTISSMSLVFTRDSRDNVFNPSKGLVLSALGEVAGGFLGQDKDFFKIVSTFDFYKTLLQKLLFELKVVAAGSDTYDDTNTLPIYERFYVGGTNTIRGFKERSVGPKDVSGDPLGGESSLYGTAEFTYPIFKLIKLATFYDFGNVWEKLGEFASGGIKYSVGVGVRVKTPVGPVKLDYGYPLKVVAGEEEEGRFHFSMTRGF